MAITDVDVFRANLTERWTSKAWPLSWDAIRPRTLKTHAAAQDARYNPSHDRQPQRALEVGNRPAACWPPSSRRSAWWAGNRDPWAVAKIVENMEIGHKTSCTASGTG